MLGGNCSPCCGCTQGTIDAFYNKVSSADVSLTLAGQTTERNDFTLILYSYFGPSVDASLLPAYVFQKTTSPVGTWPMAIIPADTFLSNGIAQISFGMTAGETLHASLTITLQPRDGAGFGNTTWPGLSGYGSFGSACKVNLALSVWQNVVTRKYKATDIVGNPQQTTAAGNHSETCNLRFYTPQLIDGDFWWDYSFTPLVKPGIWLQDRSAGSQASPISVFSEHRQRYSSFYNDAWGPQGTQSFNTLALTGPPGGAFGTNVLVRVDQANASLPSWRKNVSAPYLDFSTPYAGYVPPKCPWRTTSQADGKTLFSNVFFAGEYPAYTINNPAGIDAVITKAPAIVEPLLSPTLSFSFV